MGKTKELLIDAENRRAWAGPTPEVRPTELPTMVRFHRHASKLSQAELAKLAGVGKTVIFDIEKGKQTVQLSTLLKVLKILNITTLFQSPLMETYLRSTSEKR